MNFLILTLCVAYASALTWKDCGTDANRAVKFNSIYVRNDPITLPGQNAFNGNVEVKNPVSGDFTVDIKIWKKVWVWVKIPCFFGVAGSCSFSSGCDLLEKIVEKGNAKLLEETCPGAPGSGMKILESLGVTCADVPLMKQQIRQGTCPGKLLEVLNIPCIQQCPIPAMTLKLDSPLVVDLPALPSLVPSILAGGTYAVQLEVKSTARTEACLYVETSLKKA